MSIEQPEPDHPQVGDHLSVTIDTLATGGDGIARPGGFTLFIPNSAPGDTVEVEVTEVSKSFGRARILALLYPGPDRIPTPCSLAGGCPGCPLQHLRYEAQLTAKQAFVRDGLERIGRIKGVEIRPTLGMAEPWGYRNKGEFTATQVKGRLRLGYHAEDGEGGKLPVTECPIHHPLTLRILHETEAVAQQEKLPLAQLITRISPEENSALAILVCWEEHPRLLAAAEELSARVPELAGVLWSRVRGRSVVRRTLADSLVGHDKLLQRLGRWEYIVSAESFFQVNSEQAAKLVNLVTEYAGDLTGAILADGYCGVGTFLVPLAGAAQQALGIEEHPVALRDASDNLARYGIHDVHLYEARVETIFARLLRKGRSLDVVVLDPPRKGAGRSVLESVAQLGARRVVLVSCDPATLGRDAGDLAMLGYRVQVVQPVDMFPQTGHVETVALAVRE